MSGPAVQQTATLFRGNNVLTSFYPSHRSCLGNTMAAGLGIWPLHTSLPIEGPRPLNPEKGFCRLLHVSLLGNATSTNILVVCEHVGIFILLRNCKLATLFVANTNSPTLARPLQNKAQRFSPATTRTGSASHPAAVTGLQTPDIKEL